MFLYEISGACREVPDRIGSTSAVVRATSLQMATFGDRIARLGWCHDSDLAPLVDCPAPMPKRLCDMIALPVGSTYGAGVATIRRRQRETA